MHKALMIILAITSIILIISVLGQESKSDGLSGSIGGGAEQLFGKKRARGYDAILRNITIVSSIIFMVLSIVLVVMK